MTAWITDAINAALDTLAAQDRLVTREYIEGGKIRLTKLDRQAYLELLSIATAKMIAAHQRSLRWRGKNMEELMETRRRTGWR